MTFRDDLIHEIENFENGVFEYFYKCQSTGSEWWGRVYDKPFRALGKYIPNVIEIPPGEGGGQSQHYLVEFTNQYDASDVHYIKFDYYYNSWDGPDVDDLHAAIVAMKPVRKWVTVYEPIKN